MQIFAVIARSTAEILGGGHNGPPPPRNLSSQNSPGKLGLTSDAVTKNYHNGLGVLSSMYMTGLWADKPPPPPQKKKKKNRRGKKYLKKVFKKKEKKKKKRKKILKK